MLFRYDREQLSWHRHVLDRYNVSKSQHLHIALLNFQDAMPFFTAMAHSKLAKGGRGAAFICN